MHLARLTAPVAYGPINLEPGDYLVEDHNAAELLWHGRGFGAVELSQREIRHAHPSAWRDLPSILVTRVGGFGDLLWLNAIYAEMKRQRPEIEIRHACFPRYTPVLQGYADCIEPYPLNRERVDHSLYWLENLIEGQPCVGDEHPCDRLAAVFGLPPLERKAAYTVTPAEAAEAAAAFPRRKGVRRLCVQTESSGGAKSYPRGSDLLGRLLRLGIEIVVVGDPRADGRADLPAYVYDCRRRGGGLTIRQSIAMAATCDAILAPDSAFVHVGAALDIPVVGLFGPFDGTAYMRGHRGVALQGRLACSPCHWHPRGMPFPAESPCTKTARCEALANVPVEAVVEAVAGVLRNDQGRATSGAEKRP